MLDQDCIAQQQKRSTLVTAICGLMFAETAPPPFSRKLSAGSRLLVMTCPPQPPPMHLSCGDTPDDDLHSRDAHTKGLRAQTSPWRWPR